MYDFDASLAVGKKAEAHIDKYFSDEFVVRPVSMEFERRGIDRTWIHKDGRWCWSVEYKTDWRAGKSGNAFMELWSVEGKTRGWVYTTHAQVIVYYVPDTEVAYLCWGPSIKALVNKWLNTTTYKQVKVPNGKLVDGEIKGEYNSVGLLVPLNEFAKASYKQERIPWVKTATD